MPSMPIRSRLPKTTLSNHSCKSAALGVFATALLAASTACADTPTYCVSNDSELVSALNLAQTSALTVQLRQGTYHLNQTVWNANLTPATYGKFHAGSSLLGGYTNATCTTRNIDVDNTIITDTTTNPYDEVDILGDATIEGITFHLTHGLAISADTSTDPPLPAGSLLTIRRSVFTQSINFEPLFIFWREDPTTGGTVRLVNNLVYGNSNGNMGNAGIEFFIFSGKPKIELINNTVVDNTGSLGGASVSNFDQFSVYAYNNIFFGNAGKDFAVDAGNQIVLVNNVIGTHSYPTPAQAPSGTTTGDPKLDSAHKPIESPPSPVINTGTTSVIGGLPSNDIAGRARTIGSEPDRGAYESSISDAVLQSVTNTNDSGPGSLRAAILSANAGTGTGIFFNLSSCPATIAPVTALPPITAPIVFAGYSQTGSSRNTLSVGDDAVICVILDGTPHNLADGLYVPDSAANTTTINIEGMAFSGFAHSAVGLYGGSGHTITGSHIGGNVGGTNLDPVGTAIIVGPGVHDVTIGGDFEDYSLRNIIGSTTGDGISIDGPNGSAGAAHDNQVIDNYIGVGWNPAGSGSFTNRGNGDAGIVVGGYNNDIERNYFEYNAGYGVDLTGATAHDNSVEFNFIGYIGSFTDTGSGNGGGGVVNENDAHDNAIEYNSIWFNAGTGVRIINGQSNIIYDNQLVGNGGLGIDLAGAGVTLNDNDSGAQTVDYANRGINFPVITGATGGHNKGTISGTLTTIPGFYYLQFYVSPSCDASGYGEGEFYFASTQVLVNGPTINGQATASFSVVDSSSIGFVDFPIVTAVATDGNNNTSEFSQCFTYDDETIFADGFGN